MVKKTPKLPVARPARHAARRMTPAARNPGNHSSAPPAPGAHEEVELDQLRPLQIGAPPEVDENREVHHHPDHDYANNLNNNANNDHLAYVTNDRFDAVINVILDKLDRIQESASGSRPSAPLQSVPSAPSMAHSPVFRPIHSQAGPATRAEDGRPAFKSQHLKTSNITVPTYSGSGESKTPYDFLLELERYKQAVNYSDEEMLLHVVPLAMLDDAYMWFRKIRQNFVSWADFKIGFRREFQSPAYTFHLKREIEDRFQGPDEPLTKFIQIIDEYFDRLDPITAQTERVHRIMRNMHPSYRHLILARGREFRTVSSLVEYAYELQAHIAWDREYRAPSEMPGIEPKLGYKRQAGAAPVLADMSLPQHQSQHAPAISVTWSQKAVSGSSMMSPLHVDHGRKQLSVVSNPNANLSPLPIANNPQEPAEMVASGRPSSPVTSSYSRSRSPLPYNRGRSPLPYRDSQGYGGQTANRQVRFRSDSPHPNFNQHRYERYDSSSRYNGGSHPNSRTSSAERPNFPNYPPNPLGSGSRSASPSPQQSGNASRLSHQ